ncbi:MAG: hypothetical protein RR939_06855, partial [Acinetobacter sp.]
MAVDIAATNYNYIDKVVNQVEGKLRFFENKIGTYANDVSKALSTISNIEVESVTTPPNLPKPNEKGYEILQGVRAPELRADLPKPSVLDIDIQQPKELVAPQFTGLDISIPDAPILNN